jgi:sterol desaturase/sphingolipid hydroxylase (fatty acid hydroxylase superfamily)
MLEGALKLVAALLIVGAAFHLLERRFPSVRGQRLFRRGFRTDVVYWFVTPVVVGGVLELFATGFLALAIYLNAEGIAAYSPGVFYGMSEQPIALQIVLGLVLGDLVNYLQHRLFHFRTLWPFHAVHHSSRELDWLSAVRLHPLNNLGARGAQAMFLFLMGFDPEVTAACIPIIYLYAVFLHSNCRFDFGPLRYLLGSPVYHRWHHTVESCGGQKNFATMFPFWDLLFGTFYMPRGIQPDGFGQDVEMGEDFIEQCLDPFLDHRTNARAAAPPDER